MNKEGLDLIVASDIVACPYAKDYENLITTLEQLFSGSDGRKTKLLLCYKSRNQSEEAFFSALKESSLKFKIDEVDRSDLHPDFINYTDIKIFTIIRS